MKDWTIIIYMAGDNNLSEDMITALKDLKAFAENRYVNIIAFYDTNYPPKRISIYDFTIKPPKDDLEFFELKNGVYDVLNKPVPTGATTDYFDTSIEFVPLIKFVPWVLKQPRFKAKNYALVLSGHSDGILGKTILRDDNPPNSVTLKKLGEILETCRKALVKSNPKKERFDLLGFDSCLMGMMESAYEIKDTAKYMVSSEGNIPNAGWNYATVFKKLLLENGNTKPKDFAISIVENYACYNYDFIGSGRSINISAYDLEKIELFAKRLDLFAKLLLKILDLNIAKTDKIKSFINGLFKQKFINYILQSHYYSQTFMHDQAVDILDFEDALVNSVSSDFLLFALLGEISEENNLLEFPKVITNVLTEYLELPADHLGFILKSCFVGAEYQFSKGVSVFFPWSQMPMKMILSEYNKLKFTIKYKNWRRFIKKYIELTNRTPDSKLLFNTKNLDDLIVIFQAKLKATDEVNFETEILIKFLQVLVLNENAGRQYIGRQYIGRQYIGRGDTFYDYFSQMRNYPPFKLDCGVHPPREIGLTNCCDKYKQDDSMGCNEVEQDDS